MSRFGRFVHRTFHHKKKGRGFFSSLLPDDPVIPPVITPPDPLFGELAIASLEYSAIDIYNTFVAVYVQRTNGFDGDVRVDYRTNPGTALPGVDYTAVTGTLIFPAHSQNQQLIAIPILQRSASGDFDFEVEILNPGGGAELQSGREIAAITIQRRGNGTAVFAGSNWYIQNPTPTPTVNLTVYVQRNVAFKGAVSVDWHTTDGTAVAGLDYTAGSGTLSWVDTDAAPKAIVISVLARGGTPGDRDFTITLDNAVGGIVIDAPNPATVTISDGATPANPSVSASIANQIVDNYSEDENEELIVEMEAYGNNNFLCNAGGGNSNSASFSSPGHDFRGLANVFNTIISVTVGDLGTIFYSFSYGIWVPAVSPVVTRLNGVIGNAYSTNPNIFVAVGDGGVILKSTDHGVTWTQKTSGVVTNLNGIWSPVLNTFVAVGDGGVILKSTDGGETWAPLVSGTVENLNDVWYVFNDANNGWVVGNNGTILKTSNGTSWTPQTSGSVRNLNGVFGRDGSNVWAAGDHGTILVTSNGGANWAAQTTGTTENLNAVAFFSTTVGQAVGANGTLIKTSNGGSSWSTATLPTTGNVKDLVYTDPTGNIWIYVGPDLIPILSRDAGVTFAETPAGSIGTPSATSSGGIDNSNSDATFQPTSRFNMKGFSA